MLGVTSALAAEFVSGIGVRVPCASTGGCMHPYIAVLVTCYVINMQQPPDMMHVGLQIKEQVATAPLAIAATFIILSLASYIPIVRGFTRKEAFATSFWSTKAENWNGR